MKNKENGITLVALVITIIILLILAGITIATLAGDNGLFSRAQQAKKIAKNASDTEETILADYENKINMAISSNRETNKNPSTILYPNGTAEKPATISINKRIEIDNPYPGHILYLQAQVYYNKMWGDTGWIVWGEQGGYGVKATQIQSDTTDKIVIQSGGYALLSAGSIIGTGIAGAEDYDSSLPYRVIVICLD